MVPYSFLFRDIYKVYYEKLITNLFYIGGIYHEKVLERLCRFMQGKR